MTIAPGGTRIAAFVPANSLAAGDVADSIVLNSSDGNTNTIPVTVRTVVQNGLGGGGGSFSGVLTGGNGRGNPSQTNTYAFNVPRGQHDVEVGVKMAGDFNDGVVASLVDPEGNAVASSSNVTLDNTGACCLTTTALTVYKDNPQPGRWTFVLDWLPVEFGNEFSVLSQPFTGSILFNQVNAQATLPNGGMTLKQGQSATFNVTVKNTGNSRPVVLPRPAVEQHDDDAASGSERQRPGHDAASAVGAHVPVLRRAHEHDRRARQSHGLCAGSIRHRAVPW